MERDDGPCCRGVVHGDAASLKEVVYGLLDDHSQSGKVGDTGGIGVGEGDAACVVWSVRHGAGFIRSSREMKSNPWLAWSGIRNKSRIVLPSHGCDTA